MCHLLIVDDDAIFRTALASHFACVPGLRVSVAGNGERAYEIITVAADVDILITDIFMPEMDGIELMTRLLNDQKAPVAIAVSAHLDKGGVPYTEAMQALGCVRVIDKTQIFQRIMSDVTCLCRAHGLLNT